MASSDSEYSNRINITNLSDRDAVHRLLLPHELHNLQYHRSSQNWDTSEDEEYFKIRTHRVVMPKDGVNSPTKIEEICAICHVEFEHEEIIGTLECGHEYHIGCIKQWLLRKKNCPMCRALVLPITSTKIY
ncbi:hypothetical protein HAX54_044537 [Datura stramonium]|uniref:RING-type E3 ubiquitin transferase n=1 Tax=Datura stramonium TaxID=4076 RepID=A0ABS8RPE6_DATST|nr:hypothetical protein [Datura stramonium]